MGDHVCSLSPICSTRPVLVYRRQELTTACGFTGRDAMEQHDVQELCHLPLKV